MAVDIDDMFRRASAAVDSGNYEYAEELFREILRADPEHLNSRKALRGCCRKRYDEKGGSAKAVGIIKGIVPFVRMLARSSKPDKCVEACEDYLRDDPYNVRVLTKLGSVARKAGHTELSVFVFEDIRHQNPGRIHALRQLGEIHEDDLNDVHKAIIYYTEISRLVPSDGEVVKKLKDLNARMHMADTKLEEQESFFDGVRDKEKQKELQEKDREDTIVRSDDQIDAEIKKLKVQLQEAPGSIPHWKRLAHLFSQKKDPKSAIAAYKKVLEVDPKEFEARSRIGDITLSHGGQNLKAMEEKLAANPGDEGLKAKIGAGRKQLLARRVEECAWRCDAHPTDLMLKRLHGEALFGVGRIDDAIAQFQAALEDIRIRTEVRIWLGKCFMAKEQFDMAISQFENALATFSFLDDGAKETHYNLGLCAERLGDVDKALGHYKTIYEADIGFRDVSKKIDELAQKKRETQQDQS